jgi:hypothetical protein
LFLTEQQQQQFWSVLEAPLRAHGCLLQQQQQQKLALLDQATSSLARMAEKLAVMAEQQQPTPMLLSLLLSLCKLARVYAPEDPRLALLLLGSILSSCMVAVWATANSDDSSSSVVLPVCAVLARGLHCIAFVLEQAAVAGKQVPEAEVLQEGLSAAQALQHGGVVDTAVVTLTDQLCSRQLPGINTVRQEQLKQQGEVVLAGFNAALQSVGSGTEQLQQWAQQLQQFAAAAAAAVPLAAACNNPCCDGLGGLAEGQLVKGRRCSRCKASYCSDACQVAHWKGHMKACKLLAAAGAHAFV